MSGQVDEMSVSGGDSLDRARSLLAEADAGEITPADEDTIRGLVAEIERMRAEANLFAATTARLRTDNDALRSRLAAAERVCEVAAKRLKHYIDMPLADALDAWRAARGGDAR